MAVKISDLSAAGSVSGTQEFEINDSLTSLKVTATQISDFTIGNIVPADIQGLGALMDSELTALASVKAINQGLTTGDSPSFAGLTVDTTTLHVDSTNNRVGVGTTTPATALDVTGTVTADGLTVDGAVGVTGDLTVDTNTLYVDSTNNRVGIGTSSPARGLHVNNNGESFIRITSSDTGNAGIEFGDQSDGVQGAIFQNSTDNSLRFNGYNNSERMRIDSSGNVGIGTTSPLGLLTVQPASNSTAGGLTVLEATAGTVYGALSPTGTTTISLTAGSTGSDSTSLRFLTASSGVEAEAMRIDSSGNLLVGKTSSDATTQGFEARSNGLGIFNASNTYPLQLRRYSSNGDIIDFRKDGTTVGSVSVTASATAYNTSSDYRLKEDVQPLTGASDRVLALKPVNFAWKADGSRVDGFLAHEAQEVVPEAVTGTKDAVDDEGNPKYQGIDQSKLVPLLTAALQEALQKIEALEARVTALRDITQPERRST